MISVSSCFGHPRSQNPYDKGIPFPYHLSDVLGLGLRLGLQGMPISLGFWQWGCRKREDAHITVTAVTVIETRPIPLCFEGNSHDMQVVHQNISLQSEAPSAEPRGYKSIEFGWCLP